jgi:RNA 3'-terminal phosphate cyclase (ATP)
MTGFVEIDGSYGEGGGQIIRTSLSLAAMTGRAVQINKVRARRTKPGLAATASGRGARRRDTVRCRLSGDSVGSTSFTFEPQTPVAAGDYHFDIGTAGAAPLVVQTVLMPLTQAGGTSTVRVTGGTHVPHSPPVEYLEQLYIPALRRPGSMWQQATPRQDFNRAAVARST